VATKSQEHAMPYLFGRGNELFPVHDLDRPSHAVISGCPFVLKSASMTGPRARELHMPARWLNSWGGHSWQLFCDLKTQLLVRFGSGMFRGFPSPNGWLIGGLMADWWFGT